MKQKVDKFRKYPLVMLSGVMLFILPLFVHATVQIVQFGGTLGLVYSPSSFSAVVGDTVRWNGDFAMHPLSSTTIPVGAATWHVASGTTFNYVIGAAGTYNYRCDTHVGLGMIGSFTAAASGVLQTPGAVERKAGMTARVVSSGENVFVRLDLRANGFVFAELISLSGVKKAVLASTWLGSGSHTIPVQGIGPGIYLIRIFANGQEILTNIVVTR